MLLDSSVVLIWNPSNKTAYVNKGYEFTKMGENFICKIEDLKLTSTAKVNVKCDYCGREHSKEYRKFLKGRTKIEKDCCSNKTCSAIKRKEISQKEYGVSNPMQRKEVKEKVSSSLRISFQKVKELFKIKGLILLSNENEYINSQSVLEFVCPNHKEQGVQITNYSNLKKIKGCCKHQKFELVALKRKLDGDVVLKAFIDKGYEPKFTAIDYENNSQKLPYICSKHKQFGVQVIAYGNLQQGSGCYYCSKESMSKKMRKDENKVFEYFESRGLKICDDQVYKSKDIPIKWTCNKHPYKTQMTSYNGLKATKNPCVYCREEQSLTSLNRKLRTVLYSWKKETEKECNYKCIFTGEPVYEIHHLQSFNSIVLEALKNLNLDLRGNASNYSKKELVELKEEVRKLHKTYPLGVCMAPRIHILFHTEYGKNSNINDFYDFKKKYINGFYKNTMPRM